MISVVILTKNEEKNIERCLESVLWCDEIIVIDDYSEDETIKRIKNLELRIKNKSPKLKISKRHLQGDFSAQRNFGLSKAKGGWVLFIDADEVVTNNLQGEIKAKTQNSAIVENCDGFYLKRRDFFLGKWLKFGETTKVRLLRLGRRGEGNWIGKIHETWKVKGKVCKLDSPLHHFPHQTITSFLQKINKYTDLVAQYWLEEGRRVSPLEIIFYPTGKFFHSYVFRLGFLDGIPGLIMALMMSFHSFLARSKLWLLSHKKDVGKAPTFRLK